VTSPPVGGENRVRKSFGRRYCRENRISRKKNGETGPAALASPSGLGL